MKILLLVAILAPLATADLYKETQDFQYSRTSDDEQQKGYYSSQNGNMGGNFEISHNMDGLAHTQMKGLIQQVGSQLGIDPSDIGSGRTVSQLNRGRLYGSASASGSSYGVKGQLEREADRYESERLRGSLLASGSSYGIKGHQQREPDRYESDRLRGSSRTNYDATDSQRQYYRGQLYGETGQYSSNAQKGQLYSLSQSNSNGEYEQPSEHLSGSQTKYVATASEHHETKLDSDNHRTTVEGRPGNTLRLQVRPGQAIPLSVPVQVQSNAHLSEYERRNQQGSGLQIQQPHSNIRLIPMPSSAYGVNYEQRGQTYNADINYHANNDNEQDTQQAIKQNYEQPESERVGGRYDSRYSYEKQQQESHDSSFVSGSRSNYNSDKTVIPSSSHRPSDLGTAAQNKQGYMVGVLGVNGEGQGMTTYNSGSRAASTGRQYNTQSYRNTNSEDTLSAGSGHGIQSAKSKNNYLQAGHSSSGLNYQTDNLYNRDRILQEETGDKPKTFQSSYSYHKSWERHGDPYMILPDGSTKTITEENAKNSHSMQAEGAEHSLSTNLERLKSQMQKEMPTLCTSNCNNVKNKGYQASYSYSAQRQYGGHHDNDRAGLIDNRDSRFRRSSYSRDFEQSEDLGQQTIDLDYRKPHAQYTDHAQMHQQRSTSESLFRRNDPTSNREITDVERYSGQQNFDRQNEDTQQVVNENYNKNDQISQQSYREEPQTDYGQATYPSGDRERLSRHRDSSKSEKDLTDVFDHLENLKKAVNDETNNENGHSFSSNNNANGEPQRSRSFLDTYYPNRDVTTTTRPEIPKSEQREHQQDFGQQVEDVQQSQMNEQLSTFDQQSQQSSRSMYGETEVKNSPNAETATTAKPGLWTRTKEKVGSWFG